MDDDPSMHRLVQLFLRNSNIEIETASAGRIALHKLQTVVYDVIISDMQMPEMDGLTLIKHVRARGIETPIVVISAYGFDSTSEDALAVGANKILQKPFQSQDLVETINEFSR